MCARFPSPINLAFQSACRLEVFANPPGHVPAGRLGHFWFLCAPAADLDRQGGRHRWWRGHTNDSVLLGYL